MQLAEDVQEPDARQARLQRSRRERLAAQQRQPVLLDDRAGATARASCSDRRARRGHDIDRRRCSRSTAPTGSSSSVRSTPAPGRRARARRSTSVLVPVVTRSACGRFFRTASRARRPVRRGSSAALSQPATPSPAPTGFTITGDQPTLLAPGLGGPVPVTITNPQSFPITVSNLVVTVAAGSSQPGCDGATNLSVAQSNMSGGAVSVVVPAARLGRPACAGGDRAGRDHAGPRFQPGRLQGRRSSRFSTRRRGPDEAPLDHVRCRRLCGRRLYSVAGEPQRRANEERPLPRLPEPVATVVRDDFGREPSRAAVVTVAVALCSSAWSCVAAGVCAAGALAYWTSGSSSGSNGRGDIGSLGTGSTPSASVVGRTVTVSWAQTIVAGSPLGSLASGGYTVRATPRARPRRRSHPAHRVLGHDQRRPRSALVHGVVARDRSLALHGDADLLPVDGRRELSERRGDGGARCPDLGDADERRRHRQRLRQRRERRVALVRRRAAGDVARGRHRSPVRQRRLRRRSPPRRRGSRAAAPATSAPSTSRPSPTARSRSAPGRRARTATLGRRPRSLARRTR